MSARTADPYREQLDDRWRNYLRAHAGDADHTEWLSRVLADYRDEIVHFGAQLLNDQVIRPWDRRAASDAFEEYRTAAAAYDSDPAGWERSFWNDLRERLPATMRAKWVNPSRHDEDG